MILKLKKFGNSKGLIIPKKVLEMCDMDEEVTMIVEDQHIILSTNDKPRGDWERRFMAAQVEQTGESDMFEAISNDFDEKEWTW